MAELHLEPLQFDSAGPISRLQHDAALMYLDWNTAMTHAELHNPIPTSPKVVPLLSRIASKLVERSMHRQANIVISHTCDRGLSDMGLSRESLHCVARDVKKRNVKDARNNPKRGSFRNPF